MSHNTTAPRTPGRSAGRWFGVIAAAAVLALGASACSGDTAALSTKAIGDEDDAAVVEQVEEAETTPVEQVDEDPAEDLVTPKEPDGGDGSGLIPDHIEDDIKEAQEAQAEVEVPVVEDDSTPAAPEVTDEDTERVEEIEKNVRSLPSDPRISMDIESAAPLQRIAWSQTPNYKGCHADGDRPPYTMNADSRSHWCMNIVLPSVDAWVDVQYKIGGTKEILHITSKVPMMGNNVLTCDILNNGDGKPVLNSRYFCEKSWQNSDDGYGHGNNPQPKIVLKKKPNKVVTDTTEAQQLIIDNCMKGSNCSYKAAKQEAHLLPDTEWRLYGSPRTNCNVKKSEEHNITDSIEIAWEDRFGVKVGYDVKFLEVIKAGLEATYEHAITESRKFEEESRGWVKYGTMHAYYVQPGVVHVEGDVVITRPEAVYELKDQQFDIPLSENWVPNNGRGQSVSRQVVHSTHVPIKCKDGRPVGEEPEFPARGLPKNAEGLTTTPVKTTPVKTKQ
ncbi:MAG: hypothetical protein ACK5LO_07250 [Leucobacter sp.]